MTKKHYEAIADKDELIIELHKSVIEIEDDFNHYLQCERKSGEYLDGNWCVVSDS